MNAELFSRFLEALGRVSAQAAVLVLPVLLTQWVFRRWLACRPVTADNENLLNL